ncbi:MAG: 50S ribosomal protein L10, partial [Rubrivivax sp.]
SNAILGFLEWEKSMNQAHAASGGRSFGGCSAALLLGQCRQYAREALDVDGVKALAAIPSREVLIAQVAGLLKSPIQRLAGVLAAVAEQKGGGAESAEPAAA